MRALVLRDYYDIAVEERPDPQPGPGEVVVEVIATGICGSDFHGYSGENGRRHPGQVMGHETVGRIDELGPGVTGLAPGQLVTVNPVMGCGTTAPRAPAVSRSGAAARSCSAWPRRSRRRSPTGSPCRPQNIVTLPEEMPAELGALVEPLAVGYHAVRRGEATADDRVLVIGGGPIGQACLLAARRLGVTNLALSDVSPSRRDLCAGLGAPGDRPDSGRPGRSGRRHAGWSRQPGDRRGRA